MPSGHGENFFLSFSWFVFFIPFRSDNGQGRPDWGAILETVLKSFMDASATASLEGTFLMQCTPSQVSRS